MEEFEGRVAVVTGSASGIGLALARRFAAEGMRVVMADVQRDALEAARSDLAAGGADVLAVPTDVSQADDVRRLADVALDAFGKIHVVCNNAGVFAGGRCWEAPLSDYEWVLGVNQWGVIHGVRTFVPILLAQGEPSHIVNTASMAGLTGSALAGAYYMSKHAVVALSETLYHELRSEPAPVGVSVLCPELIRTGIGRSERNRPPHLKRGDSPPDPARDVVEGAIRDAVPQGLDPAVMADRVVDAIRVGRFYILAAEGGSWRKSMQARLDDLAFGRNPTLMVAATN